MDERIWLHSPATGGYFHCPAAAVEDHLALGWERSDPPPPPVSPVIAERIAWEQQQQSIAAAAAPKKTTKAAPRGDSEES